MSNRKGRCPTATQLTTTNYQILTTVNRTSDISRPLVHTVARRYDKYSGLPDHTVDRTCDNFPELPVHTVDPGYDNYPDYLITP
jgi:hypothetical protein